MTWLRHSMPRVRTGLAQPEARQSPFETQSGLTVNRSMLTVDLAPHVGDTEAWDPHVST